MKRFAKLPELLLLLLSVTVCLCAVETALRARAYVKVKALLPSRVQLMNSLRDGYYFKDGNPFPMLIQGSRYKGIPFELRPRLRMDYAGAEVSISPQGFRDRLYERQPSEAAVRIFGIGDSIMFGQGVVQDGDYLSMLEAQLNRTLPDRLWEVINSGVPDYNTYMEMETLKAKGLLFHPDIVVLGFTSNDLLTGETLLAAGLPDEKGLKAAVLSPSRSFTVDFVKSRLDYIDNDHLLTGNTYARTTGLRQVKRYLAELEELSRTEGFAVVVTYFAVRTDPAVDRALAEARKLGFLVVDFGPALRQYMKDNAIEDFYHSALSVPDGHPSGLAHRIAAEELYRVMKEAGLLHERASHTKSVAPL